MIRRFWGYLNILRNIPLRGSLFKRKSKKTRWYNLQKCKGVANLSEIATYQPQISGRLWQITVLTRVSQKIFKKYFFASKQTYETLRDELVIDIKKIKLPILSLFERGIPFSFQIIITASNIITGLLEEQQSYINSFNINLCDRTFQYCYMLQTKFIKKPQTRVQDNLQPRAWCKCEGNKLHSQNFQGNSLVKDVYLYKHVPLCYYFRSKSQSFLRTSNYKLWKFDTYHMLF